MKTFKVLESVPFDNAMILHELEDNDENADLVLRCQENGTRLPVDEVKGFHKWETVSDIIYNNWE